MVIICVVCLFSLHRQRERNRWSGKSRLRNDPLNSTHHVPRQTDILVSVLLRCYQLVKASEDVNSRLTACARLTLLNFVIYDFY